jgi:CDP-diacylglycerol--serine O-phosphatidyltransferase
MIVAKGWLAPLVTPALVAGLFWVCAGFSALVVAHNAGVFKRRYIADSLSMMNLTSGLLSIALASLGHFAACIVCLLFGAAFDGFDGAAARRWGGTRLGVYADDVADGVNYGIAPGVALYFALGGVEGALLGGLFTLFTVARLVYFTLAKEGADPRYFSGAPSTLGGLVVLSGLVLFEASPAVLGLLVGAACILMVSFATSHRHVGRLLAEKPRLAFAAPAVFVVLVGGYPLLGPVWPVSWMLAVCLGYGLLPVFAAFRTVLRSRKGKPSLRRPIGLGVGPP